MIISESSKEKYITNISNESVSIMSDVTKEKGGSGEFLRPHELLMSGLASCLNITTRMLLERKNIDYDKVIVKVDLNKKENLSRFNYDIEIVGDIKEEVKEEIIEMVKRCPVRKTLTGKIEVERSKEL